MEFDWDESKRISNLRKHGIDFLDVPVVFSGSIVTVEDDRFDYGEERFVTAECGQRRLRRFISIPLDGTAEYR